MREWLVENMPAGTVIGNPNWWADRLRRFLPKQEATGSGGEAVYQIRTGDGRGWIDETKAVYDWWNGSEDAPPRRILYTYPATGSGGEVDLYDAASKGFHTSESCGPEGKYLRIIKFRSLDDLHTYEDAWTKAMVAVRDSR